MSGQASGSYSKSKSKNQNAPWIGQQPFLTDVFSQAQGLYNQGTPGYYPGATYTPFNDIQQGAMGATMNRAGGSPQEFAMGDYLMQSMMQPQFDLGGAGYNANVAAGGVQPGMAGLMNVGGPGIGAASDFARSGMEPYSSAMQANQRYGTAGGAADFIGGPSASYSPYNSYISDQLSRDPSLAGSMDSVRGGMDPTANNALAATARGDFVGGNPYLDSAFDSASRKLKEQFNDSVMPGINATFGMGGRTGGGIQQEMITDAGGELGDSMAAMAADIYGKAYADERTNQLNAAGQLGDLNLGTAGLGADVYANDAARQLSAAGLGANITGDQNQDQLQRRTSAIDSYLAERGLGQDATQFGARTALDANAMAADIYNQGANRGLTANQSLLSGGLQGINSLNDLYSSVGAQRSDAASMVPGLSDLQYNNIDRMRGVGDDVQGLADRVLQDDINRYAWGPEQQQQLLQMYADIILGQSFNQGRGTSRSMSMAMSVGGGAGDTG